jgi:hypothetical protein
MNEIEKHMLDLLRIGKEKFGFLAVKAEFEAEGSRIAELLRLTEITRRVGLNFALKIGGCEAVTDFEQAQLLGANYIIAPMVESPYGLSKYIQMINNYQRRDTQINCEYFFNVETITAYRQISDILEVAVASGVIAGAVFGRVDFSGSLQLSRAEVADAKVTAACVDVARKCKEAKLQYVVGGAVEENSLACYRQVKQIYLSRFEGRKIVFSSDILSGDIKGALACALEFELLWLKNKSHYYHGVAEEDKERIAMLERRVSTLEFPIKG